MSALSTTEEDPRASDTARGALTAASPPAPIDPRLIRRLFPRAGACKATQLAGLAEAMTAPVPPEPRADRPLAGENPDIPAGYTYLGQFINHDLTIPSSAIFARQVDAADQRTPALDLDSVYGRGPRVDRDLYAGAGDPDHGIKLEVGPDIRGGNDVRIPNLPRRDKDGDGRRAAIIGDRRNDENLVIAQIHASFLMFHNEMVDEQRSTRVPGADPFEQARRQVCWHYQWLVLWDYLPLICGGAADVRALVDGLDSGAIAKPSFRFYDAETGPFVPLEFWAAAFRFGHAMARPFYFLNDVLDGPFGTKVMPCHRRIPLLNFRGHGDHPTTDLRGGHPVPDVWAIKWPYFFSLDRQLKPWWIPECAGEPVSPFDGPQKSMQLRPAITAALSNLPDHGPGATRPRSLAERDLVFSEDLGLPSGQEVARQMGIEPLAAADLAGGVDARDLPAALWDDTPLFYYILREAELERRGRSLGRVGRAIVVETIIGLLWNDPTSFLRAKPDWRPWAGARAGEPYTMAHFLTFAYRGEWGIGYPPRGPWREDVPSIAAGETTRRQP